MRTQFEKMHGTGNDFVVLDERGGRLSLTPAQIAALADRRTGIGCDQLILITPPAVRRRSCRCSRGAITGARSVLSRSGAGRAAASRWTPWWRRARWSGRGTRSWC